MKSLFRKFYQYLYLLFLFLTFVETIIFLLNEANYYGLFYLIINFVLCYFLKDIYKSINRERIVKNIIVILLGLFSSFILYLLLTSLFTFTDYSKDFIQNTFIIMKVLKPIMYLFIAGMSYLEYKTCIFN